MHYQCFEADGKVTSSGNNGTTRSYNIEFVKCLTFFIFTLSSSCNSNTVWLGWDCCCKSRADVSHFEWNKAPRVAESATRSGLLSVWTDDSACPGPVFISHSKTIIGVLEQQTWHHLESINVCHCHEYSDWICFQLKNVTNRKGPNHISDHLRSKSYMWMHLDFFISMDTVCHIQCILYFPQIQNVISLKTRGTVLTCIGELCPCLLPQRCQSLSLSVLKVCGSQRRAVNSSWSAYRKVGTLLPYYLFLVTCGNNVQEHTNTFGIHSEDQHKHRFLL